MKRNPDAKLSRLMARYAQQDSIAAERHDYDRARRCFRRWCAISDIICGHVFRISTSKPIAL